MRQGLGKYIGVCLIAWCLLTSTTEACNTPVYRYAMYNWSSSPYFVFYLSHGEPAEEDKAVNQRLTDLGTSEKRPLANVVLEMVDLDAKDQLKRLPTRVSEACAALKDDQVPTHMIWTAWGAPLATQRLTEDDVQSLVESPIRKKLGDLLFDGRMTVFFLLECKDKKKNLSAEKAVKELISQVASGEMPIDDTMEPMPEESTDGDQATDGEDQSTDGEDQASANRVEIELVKVSREDPNERWLVRMLMAIESDLEELSDEPMVFGVYGRGRAMEPYVGKGITANNLAELLVFLGGPCSCQVKDQNPGADLLMRWDWEETAEQMAKNDPTLDDPYDQFPYQEFPVDELTDETKDAESADESSAGSSESKTEGSESITETESASDTKSKADTKSALNAKNTPNAESESTGSETLGEGPLPTEPFANVTSPVASTGSHRHSFADNLLWILGIGFFTVAVFFAMIGWIVLRKA